MKEPVIGHKVEMNNLIATQVDGVWIYKAKREDSIKKVKAKYKEKPEYALTIQYEGVSKARFQDQIKQTVLDITKLLKTKL